MTLQSNPQELREAIFEHVKHYRVDEDASYKKVDAILEAVIQALPEVARENIDQELHQLRYKTQLLTLLTSAKSESKVNPVSLNKSDRDVKDKEVQE